VRQDGAEGRSKGGADPTHGSWAPPPPVLDWTSARRRISTGVQPKVDEARDGPVDGVPQTRRKERADADDHRLEERPTEPGPLDRRLAGMLELELELVGALERVRAVG